MELKTLKIKNLALDIGVAIFVLILVKSGCSNNVYTTVRKRRWHNTMKPTKRVGQRRCMKVTSNLKGKRNFKLLKRQSICA